MDNFHRQLGVSIIIPFLIDPEGKGYLRWIIVFSRVVQFNISISYNFWNINFQDINLV